MDFTSFFIADVAVQGPSRALPLATIPWALTSPAVTSCSIQNHNSSFNRNPRVPEYIATVSLSQTQQSEILPVTDSLRILILPHKQSGWAGFVLYSLPAKLGDLMGTVTPKAHGLKHPLGNSTITASGKHTHAGPLCLQKNQKGKERWEEGWFLDCF